MHVYAAKFSCNCKLVADCTMTHPATSQLTSAPLQTHNLEEMKLLGARRFQARVMRKIETVIIDPA